MAEVIGFDESKKHKVVCASCAAIVVYTKAERLIGWQHCYDGSSDMVKYIKCPNCGEDIDHV